jgi:preprotein translocase subunit SecY
MASGAPSRAKATTGVCIGFTSMLIVTSTILQMKRQVRALSQMPKLDKVMKSL